MTRWEVRPIDSKVLRLSVLVLGIGTFLLAAFFGVLGVVLVHLGAKGTTHLTMFHLSFETTDVGIGSLCVGAVIVLAMLIRISSILKRSRGSSGMRTVRFGQNRYH